MQLRHGGAMTTTEVNTFSVAITHRRDEAEARCSVSSAQARKNGG
jgi:hypothetical protein